MNYKKNINQIVDALKINFEDKEINKLEAEIEKVIKNCNELKYFDTKKVEPLIFIHENEKLNFQEIRKDKKEKKTNFSNKKNFLKNAKNCDGEYIKIERFVNEKN